MFNVEELNRKVQELGLEKIHYIAESNDGENWNCSIDAEDDNAYQLFGFDAKTLAFNSDSPRYWDRYSIEESMGFKGTYDIVLIGFGTDYAER
jgi:hypothetical protein